MAIKDWYLEEFEDEQNPERKPAYIMDTTTGPSSFEHGLIATFEYVEDAKKMMQLIKKSAEATLAVDPLQAVQNFVARKEAGHKKEVSDGQD